jgi:hypothetical protein
MNRRARDKATITIDRAKVRMAMSLTGGSSMSEVINLALDRLIASRQLRSDVAAYAREPLSEDGIVLADLPVRLDLDDEDVDHEALYGGTEAGLAHDSVANFDNTLLLSRSRLVRRLGRADPETMDGACRALAIAAGCGP